MNFRRGAALFIATGGYIGKSPVAPGTLGTLAGLPICFMTTRFGWVVQTVVILLTVALAIWAAGEAEALMKTGGLDIDLPVRRG